MLSCYLKGKEREKDMDIFACLRRNALAKRVRSCWFNIIPGSPQESHREKPFVVTSFGEFDVRNSVLSARPFPLEEDREGSGTSVLALS